MDSEWKGAKIQCNKHFNLNKRMLMPLFRPTHDLVALTNGVVF